MKILICGAGRIADELLKRISENWEITLIDKTEDRLQPFSNRFPSISRIIAGDASSPVVLEGAGLKNQDYILALTNDDRVNHAIVKFARENRIRHVMALVRDPEMLPAFQDLDIWTVLMTTVVARKIYQYLKDPRVNVIDLGQGEGELLELQIEGVPPGFLGAPDDFKNPDWRLVGILRENRLIFPEDEIKFQPGDRLLILGKADLFKTFCDMVECDLPHFPLAYGQVLVLALLNDGQPDKSDLLNTALYLAQNTKIEKILIVCEQQSCAVREQLGRWSESLNIEIRESGAKISDTLSQIENPGIVVIPPMAPSFWESLTKSVMIDLAHSLPCPLLVSKSAEPYDRILVPFNGTPITQQAIRVAIDLAQQCGAQISVAMVEEPEFLHAEASQSKPWKDLMLKQVRSIAHIHKIKIEEHVLSGNPVREILSISDRFSLMVIGSADRQKEFLSPGVADQLLRKARCSVLVVTG
jgi:trk system potassium uptake protein TrkA